MSINPTTTLPLKLLGAVSQEVGFVIDEDYPYTEQPYTNYLILEAFGLMLDATTFEPESAASLRAFPVNTGGDDFTVLACTAWMAEETVSNIDLNSSPRAGDTVDLADPKKRERLGNSVKLVKIMLCRVRQSAEHVVYTEVETVTYEALFDQSRWAYDFEKGILVLAVVLGIPANK